MIKLIIMIIMINNQERGGGMEQGLFPLLIIC